MRRLSASPEKPARTLFGLAVGSRWIDALLWLALIVTFAYSSAYLFEGYRFLFHSDDAVKSMLAKEAFREGRFIPSGWTYANGDLLFLTPYFILILLHPFLGLTYFANATASWLGFVYLLLCTWGVCRVTAPDHPRAAIVATAIAASGLSAANFDFVVGQGVYSVYTGLGLALFGLAVLCARDDQGGPPHPARLAIAFLGSTLITTANAERAVITLFAPLFAGWIVATLVRVQRRRILDPVIVAIFAGAIAGCGIYYGYLLPSVYNMVQAAARVVFAPPSVMLTHLLRLPSAWFAYFDISGPWSTLGGAGRLLQIGVWITALFIPASFFHVIARWKTTTSSDQALAWIGLACLGVCATSLVFSEALFTGGAIAMRYASFGTFTGVVLIAVTVERLAEFVPRVATAILLGLVSVSVAIALSWASHADVNSEVKGATNAERLQLIAELEQKHVGTAMADYWNSHVLSVLSNGWVMVNPVGYGEDLSPFYHHVPLYPAKGTAGPRQAVILSRLALGSDPGDAVERQLGRASERLTVGPYAVWIYDRDVVDPVFGVKHRYDRPVDPKSVQVDTGVAETGSCGGKPDCSVSFLLTNTGRQWLSSVGKQPLRIGLHGIDAKGAVVVTDLGRIAFPMPLAPGAQVRVVTHLEHVPPTVVGVQPCLLQESVRWLCERTTSNAAGAASGSDAFSQIGISLSPKVLDACVPGARTCSATVDLTNIGKQTLSPSGYHPFMLGIHALDRSSRIIIWDAGQVSLQKSIAPGESATVHAALPRNKTAQVAKYELCLLQKGVAWLCDKTR